MRGPFFAVVHDAAAVAAVDAALIDGSTVPVGMPRFLNRSNILDAKGCAFLPSMKSIQMPMDRRNNVLSLIRDDIQMHLPMIEMLCTTNRNFCAALLLDNNCAIARK